MRIAKGQEQYPLDTLRVWSAIWLHSIYNNLSFFLAQERVYPFQRLLLRSWLGDVSKAFSKSNMNVSTCPFCPNNSPIIFITVVEWVPETSCLSNWSFDNQTMSYRVQWVILISYTTIFLLNTSGQKYFSAWVTLYKVGSTYFWNV